MFGPNKVALFREITEGCPFARINITCNVLHPEIDTSPKKTPKYRKVGKPTKDLLI